MPEKDPFSSQPDPSTRHEMPAPKSGEAFDPDADTIPRDVLDRLRAGIDGGRTESFGEAAVEAVARKTPQEVISEQTRQVRDGEAIPYIVSARGDKPEELSEPPVELDETEESGESEDAGELTDGEVEKRKQLVLEVLGDKDQVESMLALMRQKIQAAGAADEDVVKRLNGLVSLLSDAKDILGRAQSQSQQAEPSPYQVMELFHQAKSLADQLSNETDTFVSRRSSLVGESSDFAEPVAKLTELHRRVKSETFQGQKDKLAGQLAGVISGLHAAFETRSTDRSAQTYSEDVSLAIGKFTNSLEYGGLHEVGSGRIDSYIADIQVIKDLLVKSSSKLSDSKQAVAALDGVLGPLT